MFVKEKPYKLLLIQIRQDPNIRREEIDSFLRYGMIPPSQLDVWNVFDQPDFDPEIVAGYDGLLVGGASEASVLEPETYPFVHNIIKTQLYCIESSIPTFSSCFGFQTAVIALNGEVIRDRSDFEMGTLEIQLEPEASSDPLFCRTPNGFLAVSCHKERALKAPPETIQLAYTDSCCHSFRVRNKPFWAFQFHPELDRKCFVERLSAFRSHYTETEDHFERVIRTFQETPHSNALLRTFIDRVIKHIR